MSNDRGDPERQRVMRGIFEASVQTILDRERIYGSGADGVGGALAAMFPEGLTLRTADDFARFYDFQMVVAKLNRYARSFEEGGHADSIHDAGNYAKLLEVKDRLIIEALCVCELNERCPVPGHTAYCRRCGRPYGDHIHDDGICSGWED